MIEPFFTAAGIFLYTAISNDLSKPTKDSLILGTLDELRPEIMGTFVERSYDFVKEKLKFKERFPKLLRDNKETLYKSVRRSQLRAIKDVCNDYREEIKGTTSQNYNLEYIKKVESYLKEEELKLTRGDFEDVILNDEVINRIISSESLPQNIQTDSATALLNELPKHETLPTRFVEMLQNGWQKDSVNHTLLGRFEFHFNIELAKPEVANPLFRKALSGIQFLLEEMFEGQANQAEEIRSLREIIESKAAELQRLGYRILYQDGKCSGIQFIGEKLDRIEGKIDRLLEADKQLTPEERKAKEKELIDKYLEEQIKDYPIADVVGEIYSADKFFVDREDEKRNLPDWLLNNEKIVVIKGISGDGKTALMTEVLRAIVPDENKIVHDKVKGILTFYFRDFSGKVLDVNLFDICKKADARLAKDSIKRGFALQYEEFRKVNPLDIPQQIIAHLCQALNSLGDIWLVFDNFESALQNGEIKDKEIEAFMVYALQTQPHLRFLITSQVLPVIPNFANIRQCIVSNLPTNFAKDFLWKKGQELKNNGIDCGLAEATGEQFDQLFTKLLPTAISLVSFVAYLETICETKGKGFEDVLADGSLFVSYRDFDADDKNKGARVLIRRQFELLSEVEQLVLKALSIFPQAIEFPVLRSVLPLSLEEETLRRILKSNSLVRKVGRNLYELLPLPNEVISKQFEKSEENNHKVFNLKAAAFYSFIHKPVEKCYTLEDFDTYFKEIEHYYQAGFYEQIVNVINKIIRKTTPLGMMNETLTRSSRIESLLEPNSEAKANNHSNIGISLEHLGKIDKAIIEYDKAISIYKNLGYKQFPKIAHNLAMAYMNKGNTLKDIGKPNEAVIEFDKAVVIRDFLITNQRKELADSLILIFVNKGICLAKLSDLDSAISEYNKAITVLKDLLKEDKTEFTNILATAYLNKGSALIRQNRFKEAKDENELSIEIFERLVNEENRIEFANGLAMSYIGNGISLANLDRLPNSVEELDKAILILKNLVDNGRAELARVLTIAYINKAISLNKLDKLTEAIVEYNKAILILDNLIKNGRNELFNDLASAYVNKGNLLARMKKFAETVKIFNQAIELWEKEIQNEVFHNLPSVVKSLRLRVGFLIILEDWAEIGSDAIKSLSLFSTFRQDENLPKSLKGQIMGEFGGMIVQIKQLTKDNQEKIFSEANKIGEAQEEKIPFGDILRQCVDGLE